MSRVPVLDQEVAALKALIVGLCVLLVMTPATAAANGQETSARPNTGASKSAKATTLAQKLALKLKAARKYHAAIRFFETHRSLALSSSKRARALARAKHRLAKTKKEIRYYRRLIRARAELHRARRLAHASPKVAICEVFGRYCDQALAVAWCESGHQTTARNGQYLGLFQMGTYARQVAGHGDSAYEQARAAHRFFVVSGRDWSPWSCRWAAS
jgi:hypothetical protein